MPVYPELAALVGSRVPDYRGIFLRGQGSQTAHTMGPCPIPVQGWVSFREMVFGRFRPLSIQGGNME